MNNCPYCGNPCNHGDSFCSVCGKKLNEAKNNGKGKSNIIIVAIICLTLIIITGIISSGGDSTAVTTTINGATSAEKPSFSMPDSATAESASATTTSVNSEPATVVVIIDQTTTEEPETHNRPPQNRTTKPSRTYYAGSYYYVRNSPDRAGLVLRSKATSYSDKLAVIKENEVVSIVDGYENSDYIYVYAVERNCYGWVLADYLAYYGNYYVPATRPTTRPTTTRPVTTRYYPTTASVNCSYRYVSYNTPSHAGINIRKSATSNSELLCTVKEGETVVVYFPMNDGDYIEISYTNPSTGKTYYGWALKKYIVE